MTTQARLERFAEHWDEELRAFLDTLPDDERFATAMMAGSCPIAKAAAATHAFPGNVYAFTDDERIERRDSASVRVVDPATKTYLASAPLPASALRFMNAIDAHAPCFSPVTKAQLRPLAKRFDIPLQGASA